jgi:hypothetical protein
MQEELNFTNEDELRAWLEKQPTEWAQVIAWRAAMRVVPVLGSLNYTSTNDDAKNQFIILCFRSIFIARALGLNKISPDDNSLILTRGAAIAFARSQRREGRSFSISTAALAVLSAALTILADAPAAAKAVATAAEAASNAARSAAEGPERAENIKVIMWEQVTNDAEILSNSSESNIVNIQPLWSKEPLNRIIANWDRLIKLKPDFWSLYDWYEAELGWNDDPANGRFDEELVAHIARQPDEWWNRSPEVLSADIAQWRSGVLPLVGIVSETRMEAKGVLTSPADHRPHYADDGIERDANGAPVDHLGVRKEARIFARLLAGQETKLPLAVGLFGPWGGGKSFFMESIRAEMATLAKEKAPGYHHAVAHITFNAWHYVDADLWASLGLRIFEGVTEHLGEGRKNITGAERDAAMTRIESAQHQKAATEALVSAATEKRTEALKALEAKQAQASEESSGELQKWLDELQTATRLNWAADFRKIAAAAGLAEPNDMKSVETTLAEVGKIAETAEKWLPPPLRRWLTQSAPGGPILTLIAVAAAAVFVVVLTPAVQGVLNERLAALVGITTPLAAAAAGWAAWLAPGLKKLRAAADLAQEYQKRFEAAGKAATPADPEAENLSKIDKELEELKSKIIAADKEIMTAEMRLYEVDSGMLIHDHLARRAKDGGYVDRQGVVATLRRDLEHLNRLLQELNPATAKLTRIVLYIDDLDRCEPARVVEVLQAVHLLLAFPLFAVIVAVDPRWLERSLYDKYVPGHLTMAPEALAKVNFTPRNYLEKIFQIPYRLKPMDDAFVGLVDGLTKGLLELPAAVQQEEQPEDLVDPEIILDDLADEAPNAPQKPSLPSSPPPESKPPEPLTLTDEEVQALKVMQPLVPTPRALKRLINIYLLTRLQKPKASESPYDPMILLGLEMGFPVAGKKLLEKIRVEHEDSEALLVDLAMKLEVPDADRLAVALREVAPEVTVRDVHRWLEFAERFSFDPPPVAGLISPAPSPIIRAASKSSDSIG